MAQKNTIELHQLYESLRGAEDHKNSLIEELLRRLDKLNEDYKQETLDHSRERQFNRDIQIRELQLLDELRSMKAAMERDAFILILIDGDGMIFEDQYIKNGENGGKEAATLLWGFVRDYVTQKIPNLSSDYKIVTRVYANLKGLGDACHRSGLLEKASLIEDFARGFTGSKQLFDFVDVGVGKDRADDKISEIFKLHLYDCHCRHILFGCSHDNGYARLLEDVADRQNLNRITLLEGVPFERELAMLKTKYGSIRFGGLFRTAKIIISPQHYPQPQSLPIVQPQPQPQSTLISPPPPQYQSPYQPVVARTSSTSTSNSSMMNPTASSWATTANSMPAHLASPPPTPQPTPPTNKVIPRNRWGQRVDPMMTYDKLEVQRVKKIKMCNVHFLRKDCPYGDHCTHDHSYAPNKNELQTLRYIARMTPCRFGSDCDDILCIYGHRCPTGSEGSKDCIFGDKCRFGPELHGIDMTVVKTMRVGGK